MNFSQISGLFYFHRVYYRHGQLLLVSKIASESPIIDRLFQNVFVCSFVCLFVF